MNNTAIKIMHVSNLVKRSSFKNFLSLFLLLLLSLVLLVVNTGCGDKQIISARKNESVAIDGKNLEWKQGGTFIASANATLYVCNDSTGLYLSLVSPGGALLQRIVATGLTVWLDPQTAAGRVLGIHYPVGLMSGMPPEMDPESSAPQEKMKERVQNNRAEFEILNEDKEVVERKRLTDADGFEVQIGDDSASYVYEMKIPIAKSQINRYTLVPDSSGVIRLGLETGELGFPMMGPPPGGMPPMEGGGGMPPPPDGGGPPPGGMPPGMRAGASGKTVYLDCWYAIKLQR
jgi:hypothetical protein